MKASMIDICVNNIGSSENSENSEHSDFNCRLSNEDLVYLWSMSNTWHCFFAQQQILFRIEKCKLFEILNDQERVVLPCRVVL